MDLDKSLPQREKVEERERGEEGVVRSLHWKPRMRWNHLNTPPCLMNSTYRDTMSTHSCSPSCVEEFPFSEAEAHGSPPLQIPIVHCGWTRTRVKHSQGGRRRITYTAPCGRKLRDLSEVGKLLTKF